MASISSLLKQSGTVVEIGEIVRSLGKNTYVISLSGTERKAYSTLDTELNTGPRVIVNRVEGNARYIVGQTRFTGKYAEQKEIFRDG